MADEVTAAVRERADAGDEEDRLFGVDEDSVLSMLYLCDGTISYNLYRTDLGGKRVVLLSLALFSSFPHHLR